MTYREIAEFELKRYKISWCRGLCGDEGHKRGFVNWDEPVIHFDSEVATRSTLHGFFHEIGHVVLDHKKQRSYIREAQAEKFANEKFREYGIAIPRKCVQLGKQYVARKKRHGDNAIEAKKGK